MSWINEPHLNPKVFAYAVHHEPSMKGSDNILDTSLLFMDASPAEHERVIAMAKAVCESVKKRFYTVQVIAPQNAYIPEDIEVPCLCLNDNETLRRNGFLLDEEFDPVAA